MFVAEGYLADNTLKKMAEMIAGEETSVSVPGVLMMEASLYNDGSYSYRPNLSGMFLRGNDSHIDELRTRYFFIFCIWLYRKNFFVKFRMV